MKLIDLLDNYKIGIDIFYRNVEYTIKNNPQDYENYQIDRNFKETLLSQNVRIIGQKEENKTFFIDFFPITIFFDWTFKINYEGYKMFPPIMMWHVFPTEEKGEYLLHQWCFDKIRRKKNSIFQNKIKDLLWEREKYRSPFTTGDDDPENWWKR